MDLMLRTVEVPEEDEIYVSTTDLLEFILMYSEEVDLELVAIGAFRELYDVISQAFNNPDNFEDYNPLDDLTDE